MKGQFANVFNKQTPLLFKIVYFTRCSVLKIYDFYRICYMCILNMLETRYYICLKFKGFKRKKTTLLL